MKSVTADLQQKLYIFLQNSKSRYRPSITNLLAFTGQGITYYLTFSEWLGMNLQDDTHVCYYHWGFQAMIESWVLCVWTHQLRAKTHEIKHERQTRTHNSANKTRGWWTWILPQKQPCQLWIAVGNWFWFVYLLLSTSLCF